MQVARLMGQIALALVLAAARASTSPAEAPKSEPARAMARRCVDTTKIAEDDLLAAVRSSGVTDHTIKRALNRLTGSAKQERAIQLLLDAPHIDDAFRCCDVARFPAAELTAAQFAGLEAQRRPFIVQGGIDHWKARNWSMASVVEQFGTTKVKFSQQVARGEYKTYEGPLSSFNTALPGSTHHRALYSLDEDLAYANARVLDSIGEVLLGVTDTPNGDVAARQSMATSNAFRWLPPELRFSDRALMFGGTGARSSLHADMTNWTGWNALFTGTKFWRFFPPTTHIPSVNRHGKLGNVAADHKSAVNTFEVVCLNQGADEVGQQKERQNMSALGQHNRHSYERQPDWEAYPEMAAIWSERIEFVQHPGEVVVIPPGWWHQVYHATAPTIGFASQYAGKESLPDVVASIAEWQHCELPDMEVVHSVAAATSQGTMWSQERREAELIFNVTACACIKEAKEGALSGNGSSCDPRWVSHSRRNSMDGSWLAEADLRLRWTSPLRFEREVRDDDVSALPPVHSRSASIEAPSQEQQPRTRREARKRMRQQKQSRAARSKEEL